MITQEKKVLSDTEQALRDALARIVAGTPTHPKYKKRIRDGKPLKILPSIVEEEAGKTNGALKHYTKLKEDIENAENKRIIGASTVDVKVVKAHPSYQKAIKERDTARSNNKESKAELKKEKAEVLRKEALLKENAAQMDEMIAALWAAIPEDVEREHTIKKINNVVNINFKKDS